MDLSTPFSAGGLYSTVEDLYIWDQALYTNKLLPDSLKQKIFTPYVPALGAAYGYAWFLGNAPVGRSTDSVAVIEHGGGINGFNTLISRIPADKDLVVLLNNTGGTRLGEMSRAIRGILYDKPYDLPRRSVADTLYAVILSRGLGAGLECFRDLTEHHADTYDVREDEMNVVGYRFLRTGKVKEAIAVFKLNVGRFPKSSNVYDSLGEAYMDDGQNDLAIENYRKSVELNPANTNGVEMLKKLGAK